MNISEHAFSAFVVMLGVAAIIWACAEYRRAGRLPKVQDTSPY